ncbi:MAG: DUF2179 domain-containing protein [candidate division Zixibacteria bacterium]|jgi:uncharacterized protein YebE (UPF0316 family)|nr:DUF2179 domain-containing protein [candidate division Zixibacteria bacterium]
MLGLTGFAIPELPWYILPVLIFLARILDVSIGTIRIILVARDMRAVASVMGFFEVLIWLLAISQIMQNLTSWENYIAYAAGFAMGTWVGMTIERKLAIGTQLVRVILPKKADDLLQRLIMQGHQVTHVPGEGGFGPVTIIFLIVPRSQLSRVIDTIKRFDPNAFYTIEDVRTARNSRVTAGKQKGWRPRIMGPFQWFRKGK